MAQLLHLESRDETADISFYINSPGGSLEAMFSIHDTMEFVRPHVATYCMGQAAFGAAVLLAAGCPGKRYALRDARILIGPFHAQPPKRARDLKKTAKYQLRMNEVLTRTLSRHTQVAPERLRQDMERDFLMNAEEARSYGIVDHVLETRSLT
jgi:ATP-dependent Clp protease protease subunit